MKHDEMWFSPLVYVRGLKKLLYRRCIHVALISWAFKGIDAILIGNLVSGVPAPCRGAISTLMSQDDTQQLWPLFTADASELSDLSQAVIKSFILPDSFVL